VIRLTFLVSSLNRGGAQRQLTLLVKEIDRTRFAITVITIYACGSLCHEIENLDGVQVYSLRGKGGWGIPASLWRLWRVLHKIQPEIVHGYLDVANVLALVFGKAARAKVVWGVRASNVDYSQYGRRPAFYFRLAAWLSRFADLIVANSYAGKRHHAIEGYAAGNMIVIPNGFDTDRFRPDEAAGRQVRREWGVADHESLIGIVARLDPMKDHHTFLFAANRLAEIRPDVRFVCVGDGRDGYREELHAFAKELGLDCRIIWTGEMADMPAVHNAFDIATSATAFGEGFSNAVGEAMACGIPCVVTDVGDSALLVGETGLVVAPGDPEALCEAWLTFLEMPAEQRKALGLAARVRITSEYSLRNLAHRTAAELARLVSR
jgi:glycosyltransferase involved in cell wall biosynthesis